MMRQPFRQVGDRLPQAQRFNSCSALRELIKLTGSVRAVDVYWRQYVRTALGRTDA